MSMRLALVLVFRSSGRLRRLPITTASQSSPMCGRLEFSSQKSSHMDECRTPVCLVVFSIVTDHIVLSDRIGPVVSMSDCITRGPRIEPALQIALCFTKSTAIHILGHRLHTYCLAWVDSAFHPPWDGKMNISLMAE